MVIDSVAAAQKLKGCTKIDGILEIQIRGGSEYGIFCLPAVSLEYFAFQQWVWNILPFSSVYGIFCLPAVSLEYFAFQQWV